MSIGQMIGGVIFLALTIGAFLISYLQFKEKGYLFNNAYFWASQEERKRMDESKESKRPHYRQSGFAFLFIGIICLMGAVYILTNWIWILVAFWISVIIAVVYAIVSAVQIERHK